MAQDDLRIKNRRLGIWLGLFAASLGVLALIYGLLV